MFFDTSKVNSITLPSRTNLAFRLEAWECIDLDTALDAAVGKISLSHIAVMACILRLFQSQSKLYTNITNSTHACEIIQQAKVGDICLIRMLPFSSHHINCHLGQLANKSEQ
jgi:hypothetical protein